MPHQDYVIDGKKWPSATELTRLLPQPWLWSWYKHSVKKDGYAGWEANLKKSEEGQLIGTQVHEILEHLVKKESYGQFDLLAFAYAQSIYNTLDPTIEEYLAVEPHLVSEKLKIHGTADIIVRRNYDTGLWIYDYKTSNEKDVAHPIQLCIYAIAWNEQNNEQQINKGAIVRINKKSKNLTVSIDEYLDLAQYIPIVKSLRIIWEYLNAK